MSSIGGPNNIRDGLVLFVDASNSKSFRGEPTVNLINNPMPTGTTNFIVGSGIGTATYEANEKAVRWVRTSYETWGAYYYNDSLANYLFDTGSTYAISFEWKHGSLHNAGTSHYFQIVQGNGQNQLFTNFNLLTNSILQDNGWYYFSKTGAPANAGITQTGQPPQYRLICGNITGKTTDIYWRKLQFEKKSYATPFVDGTRGATVATGGGMTDLTNNFNDGEFVSGVTYSSDKYGNLVFDGNGGQVVFNSNDVLNFGIGGFTISFWCNRSASGFQGGSYINKGPGTSTGIGTRDSKFYIYSDLGQIASINMTSTLNVFENHVFTVNQDTSPYIKHYINGVNNQTGYVETPANLGSISNDDNFILGFSNAGGIPRYFNGKIAYLQVYSRVLSDSEIIQNYIISKSRFGL